MMLAEVLNNCGHTINGPYNCVADAMHAAKFGELHAGVLDVNVGGEQVYPIASALAKRNIPFVFLTGYSVDTIHPSFTNVPVLQKPVEPDALLAALGAIPAGGTAPNPQFAAKAQSKAAR